jgi:hypothetical protein
LNNAQTIEEVANLPWIRALRPVGEPYRERLSSHSPLVVWHVNVAFEEWPIPNELASRWTNEEANASETWRKRPLAKGEDSGCIYSCGEVELAARLRTAGLEAFWISEWSGFPHVDCWSAYCVKRSELRERLSGVWAYDQKLRVASERAGVLLGKSGGHPDVVAWEPGSDDCVYLEYKGPNDTIKAKQNGWAQAVLEQENRRLPYVVVKGAFKIADGQSTLASPTFSHRGKVGDDLAAGSDGERRPFRLHSLSNPTERSRFIQQGRRGMSGKEKLHRRTIRDTLVREKKWDVVSHVDGKIDVRVPSSASVATFKDEVRQAVEDLGYIPTIIVTRDGSGNRCVRLHTSETLAQSGRGAHRA